MTRNQDSLDSLLCAMVRSTNILLWAMTSTISRLGHSLIVFKVDKTYRTCDSERLSGVDGETLMSILPEFNWQITKASHLSLWECQSMHSSHSLWNKRASNASRSSAKKVKATWEASKSSIATDRLIWLIQIAAQILDRLTLIRTKCLLDWHSIATVSQTKGQDDLVSRRCAPLVVVLSLKCLMLLLWMLDHHYRQ